MSMFDWLNKKPQPEPEPEAAYEPPPEGELVLLNIQFLVKEDGHLYTDIDWDQSSSEALAKVLGKVLYMITSNSLNKDILDRLEAEVQARPDEAAFVQTVLSTWSKFIDKAEGNKNKPVVGPMEFLSNIKKDLQG
jgi:hypothetical protein